MCLFIENICTYLKTLISYFLSSLIQEGEVGDSEIVERLAEAVLDRGREVEIGERIFIKSFIVATTLREES